MDVCRSFFGLKQLAFVLTAFVALQTVAVRPVEAGLGCTLRAHLQQLLGPKKPAVVLSPEEALAKQLSDLESAHRDLEHAWLLEASGRKAEGQAEIAALERMLATEEIADSVPIGTGVTDPEIGRLENGQKVVVKKDIGNWASDVDKEVLAYKLDRLLNLRIVPVTAARKPIKGMKTIVQYWVEKRGPSVPELREGSRAKMTFFDLLIGNGDRHGGNRIRIGKLFEEKEWVAIDHGLAFVDDIFEPPVDLREMVPPRETLERLKAIGHRQWRKALSPPLGPTAMRVFLKRREALIKMLELYDYATGSYDSVAYEALRAKYTKDLKMAYPVVRELKREDFQIQMQKHPLHDF